MFRFIYKYNNTNTPEIPLSQDHYPLEEITQLFEWRDHLSEKYKSVMVSKQYEPVGENEICVFPIDFQSTPIDAILYPIEKICGDAETYYPDNKKIILIYTTTEPFFFSQNDEALLGLVTKFKNLTFVLSGSGHTHITPTAEAIMNMPNVKFVTKLWYFDRVHYNKTVRKMAQWHFRDDEVDAPDHIQDYVTCPNKFMLTMRNPRPHRLIMSSLVENSKTLDSIRYSRNWSLKALHIEGMLQDQNIGSEESIYQTHLILHSLDVLRKQVGESQYRSIIDTAFGHSHILDMPSVHERGVPAKWLYDDINIAIIAGGEGEGYGYADEKQMIPMYYRKPFISFGCKGINEEMETIGFKVFRDCWDLSWSNADTLWERVNGCHELIKDLQAMSDDDLLQVLTNTQEQINSNYYHITKGIFRVQSNENFLGSLEDACS